MDFDESVEANGDAGEGGLQDDLMLIDEDTSNAYKSLKDCVIFLIDCSKSMQNGVIPQILTAAESFLKTKVISNEKDLFGLVLYNTSKMNNELNFENVNILIGLSAPDAALIKKIKAYRENQPDDFDTNPKEINSLSNALWITHALLKNYDQKLFNRRIFLFTDNDDPLPILSDKQVVIQRAKDMLESEIIIELFPMNFTTTFDLRKFYLDIIPVSDDGDKVLEVGAVENRLRELTKRIRQKEIKKRALGTVPFFLTPNVKIFVNVYSTLKKANKGRIYNVDAKTNKPLNTINQATCKTTGQILYQNQIGTHQVYGSSKIPFTKDDMKKIKTLDEPGMKLLGFKNFSSIKPYYNVRESYFIYPDDIKADGSGKLSDAMIKGLVKKNKVAIVKFVAREGTTIKIAALVPQKESFDEDYFQTPPGFNLIFLPFADDIRSNTDILGKISDFHEDIPPEKEEIARKLIKKMNITFDCRNFENPTIQKFYSTLQALALGESEVEKVDDLIQPDEEALLKVLNGTDEEFRKIFYGESKPADGDDKGKQKRGKKGSSRSAERKPGNKKEGMIKVGDDDVEMNDEGEKEEKGKRGKKKVKKEDFDEFSNENLMKQMEENGLNKYNVTQLKDICKMKGVPTKKSKKPDIIEEISDYLYKQLK